jgi:GDPmannose 4,6-dehydratase
MPRAFITGITGQDGSYLADLLLEKGYEVHGMVRRTSTLNRSRIDHLYRDPTVYERRLFLHYADLDDPTPLRRALIKAEPDELYHLAGQSHVGLSFEMPESTCELTAMGTLRLLEAVRELPRPPRLFHASSSEIFGVPPVTPQDERTPLAPVSPYGCAKAFAAQMVAIYRATFGLFACNGIMYNHESPRRGENFVTQKVCRAAAAIKLGLQHELVLGSLASERDWGHASDFVRAMWLMLQQDQPGDFILATGRLHTVRDVIQVAFDAVGLDWHPYLKQDPRLLRPAEPERLLGNAAKARDTLGWSPQITFEAMIREMTLAQLDSLAATADHPSKVGSAA